VVAEESCEHLRARGADGAVRAGIGRVGRGVPASGSQFVSATVFGLPSVSARRIAVTGRQSW
jgi:hypothetical protein